MNDDDKLKTELLQLKAMTRWLRHPVGVIGLLNLLLGVSHRLDLWSLVQIGTGVTCLFLALYVAIAMTPPEA